MDDFSSRFISEIIQLIKLFIKIEDIKIIFYLIQSLLNSNQNAQLFFDHKVKGEGLEKFYNKLISYTFCTR